LRTTCGLAAWPVAIRVQPRPLGHGEPLGDTGDLHGAHEVDDELVGRPRTGRSEVHEIGRQRREHPRGGLQVGGVRAHQQRQGSRGGGVRKPRDRGVDVPQAPVTRGSGDAQDVAVRERGALGHDRAGRRPGEDPVRAVPDRACGGVVAHHHHDRVGTLDGLTWRGGRTRPEGDQIARPLGGAVVDDQVVSGREEASGHPPAHPSQPDDGHPGHGGTIRAGR